ncbi:hypothetical protein ACFX1Q_020106 [Malus domestica]
MQTTWKAWQQSGRKRSLSLSSNFDKQTEEKVKRGRVGKVIGLTRRVDIWRESEDETTGEGARQWMHR